MSGSVSRLCHIYPHLANFLQQLSIIYATSGSNAIRARYYMSWRSQFLICFHFIVTASPLPLSLAQPMPMFVNLPSKHSSIPFPSHPFSPLPLLPAHTTMYIPISCHWASIASLDCVKCLSCLFAYVKCFIRLSYLHTHTYMCIEYLHIHIYWLHLL